MLESVRHPNIVLFMGWCSQPHLAIVAEFMHRGSLFKLLRRGGDRPLDPRMQRSGRWCVWCRCMWCPHAVRLPNPFRSFSLPPNGACIA